MSANRDEYARLDVAASGIWGGRFEQTCFDVRVFNPYAPSNQTPRIQTSYQRHENEKRRKYERVIEIEQSTFVPFGTCVYWRPSPRSSYEYDYDADLDDEVTQALRQDPLKSSSLAISL